MESIYRAINVTPPPKSILHSAVTKVAPIIGLGKNKTKTIQALNAHEVLA